MRKYLEIFWGKECLAFLAVVLTVYACANRGYPEGGPQDTTPPKVINEDPVSFTTNFDKKRVNVYFDEYVQLKDMNEKFIVSPPLKKKPKVSLKGKYIQVALTDTLKPNTTYSLDFADGILDNNEGNPLGYYRYVFSTGDNIDSLELSGKVVYAESGEPMLNVYVLLYSNHADSIPLRELPDYVARTDSSGFFRLTNLRDTVYRILAVEDANRDYKFTPEAEVVGFLDSLVRPVVMSLTRTDTITRIENIVGNDTITSDSISTYSYLAYGPNNLFIRLFQEKPTQLYMVDDDRPARERLDFTFSIPGKNDLQMQMLDSGSVVPRSPDWYLLERSAGNDTLSLWIKDSTVYKQDTLRAILSYWRTDTTGQLSRVSDTVRYTFKEKKKEVKGKKKDDAGQPAVEFLEIKPNTSGDLDIQGNLALDFDRPVDLSTLSGLQVLQKVDTLYQPIPFTYVQDSLKIRRINLNAAWESGKEYQLFADSAVIFDIYGRHNDKLEKKFKVREEAYYGNVMLNVTGVSGPTIVQVYKSDAGKSENGKRKYTVLKELKLDRDQVLTFDLLPEGKYRFRAILDTNNNGVWDTGLYLKGIQPEEIIYLPVEISVKQNFDIEQEFNLAKTYKEETIKK